MFDIRTVCSQLSLSSSSLELFWSQSENLHGHATCAHGRESTLSVACSTILHVPQNLDRQEMRPLISLDWNWFEPRTRQEQDERGKVLYVQNRLGNVDRVSRSEARFQSSSSKTETWAKASAHLFTFAGCPHPPCPPAPIMPSQRHAQRIFLVCSSFLAPATVCKHCICAFRIRSPRAIRFSVNNVAVKFSRGRLMSKKRQLPKTTRYRDHKLFKNLEARTLSTSAVE